MPEHSIRRNGLTQLSSPANGLCEVNIILVHGLRGHPQTTWEDNSTRRSEHVVPTIWQRLGKRKRTSRPNSTHNTDDDGEEGEEDESETRGSSSMQHNVFWPRDYLVEDFPKARVWTYGYNANVINGMFQANNQNSISQHGRDFTVRTERILKGKGFNEPIIFIAHSLGGIIVKDAICRSNFCSSRTKLIIFLGTPHRGSSMAGWGSIASNLAAFALQDFNKPIVRNLQVNSEVLDNIHAQFINRVGEKGIMIHSFQEARGITGVKGLEGKVVDDFSSKVGLPEMQETVETIDADHMQMARCSNRTDQQYESISGVIQLFIAEGFQRSVPPSIASKPLFHVPHLRNEHFGGRDQILKEIENHFFVKKRRRLAVFGLGGAGKTQVALEFAYRLRDREPEYSVFWVLAQSQATFEQSYAGLAKLLRISGEGDQKMLVKQHLSSENAGKWLLIVDNADDHEATFESNDSTGMIKYLPQNSRGLTLFTTRLKEVAVDVAINNMVELGGMNPEEATNLFKTHSINHPDQNETIIEELVKELTYLPLAIVQAASYMNKNTMSVEKYLGLLQGEESNAIKLMERDFYDNTLDMTKAVLKTWTVSFEQIRKCDRIAAEMFSYMACLDPKAIPQSLLPAQQLEVDFEHAIGTLLGYAFITRREDGSMFDMHRLVHIAIRAWLQDHGLKRIRTDAITYLSSVPLFGCCRCRIAHKVWREYISHALRLLEESRDCQMREIYELSCNVGAYLEHIRRFREAIKVLSKAVAWRKEHNFQDDILQYPLEYYLANAYSQIGQHQRAIELLEPMVVVEDESPIQVAMQFTLAGAYINDKQVERAIRMYERTAVIYETLPEDHPDRLTATHQLALASNANGQSEDAIKMFERIIPILREVLGKEHVNVLTTEHALATTYYEIGQFEETISILERIISIMKKNLAEDDLFYLDSQLWCADTYCKTNRAKEAIRLYEHVRTVQKKMWAEDDKQLLTLENNLAVAYLKNRQLEEGINLLEHVVAIQKATLAKDDISKLQPERNLADAYIEYGKIEDAIKILERVIAILLTIVDEDDKFLIDSRELLAKAYDAR
ncbi:hypothetical protein F4813DRAFT_346255 [Daldinia decipiens]|uniref:uncharacterized protein n=1 Tax=Daldinia decipiens TaxID=326647 RepID=UPI0020C27056|nr:uncharacterized protein F4813DRAFT_346255 [Daldinia decipiens]KAI1661935.1 hypothetical protein F4813DRAFT_346255 [Daldinia decipiens]